MRCFSEYEETMDALQRDLEACEKENAELKERAKNMSKKALLMVLFWNRLRLQRVVNSLKF